MSTRLQQMLPCQVMDIHHCLTNTRIRKPNPKQSKIHPKEITNVIQAQHHRNGVYEILRPPHPVAILWFCGYRYGGDGPVGGWLCLLWQIFWMDSNPVKINDFLSLMDHVTQQLSYSIKHRREIKRRTTTTFVVEEPNGRLAHEDSQVTVIIELTNAIQNDAKNNNHR